MRKKEASHKYFRDAVHLQIGMDPPSHHQLTQQTNTRRNKPNSLTNMFKWRRFSQYCFYLCLVLQQLCSLLFRTWQQFWFFFFNYTVINSNQLQVSIKWFTCIRCFYCSFVKGFAGFLSPAQYYSSSYS